jgi:SAM-dependent methyltransferase
VLVERAQELAEQAGVDVRFDVADCERLPYEDASFDVVSSAIGHMFAPDHDAAARELARVCRPGARLGLACWRGESGVGELFRVMAPFQPPRPPGVGDPFDWGREEYVEERLGEAFELTFEEADSPQTAESGEDVWELFSSSYGPTKTLADSLPPDRRQGLHRAWVEMYEGHRVDGGIRQPRLYLLTIGRRR